MIEESPPTLTYEITAESIRAPWVNRSLRQLLIQRRAVPPRRLGSAVAAAGVAALLHGLLLGSVLYGGTESTHARRMQEWGIGSAGIVSEAEPVMTLILIADGGSTRAGSATDDVIASRGLTAKDLAIVIASPNAFPAVDTPAIDDSHDEASPDMVLADDRASRAVLFQRYTGQIQARIERAWMRPRSGIGADSFECRVQILQDRRGNVTQTTLQHCNGTPAWQVSLVQAIQTASPLPAPPSPDVFADALTLAFTSAPYHPGGADQGFEPEQRLAQVSAVPRLQP